MVKSCTIKIAADHKSAEIHGYMIDNQQDLWQLNGFYPVLELRTKGRLEHLLMIGIHEVDSLERPILVYKALMPASVDVVEEKLQ